MGRKLERGASAAVLLQPKDEGVEMGKAGGPGLAAGADAAGFDGALSAAPHRSHGEWGGGRGTGGRLSVYQTPGGCR